MIKHRDLQDFLNLNQRGRKILLKDNGTEVHEIYYGFLNPYKTEISKNKLYEYDGLFRYIVGERIPKVVSVVKLNDDIVSYGMLWQNSVFLIDPYYDVNRINLGYCGIWTHLDHRGNGYARKTIINMGNFIEKVSKTIPSNKPLSVRCDDHIAPFIKLYIPGEIVERSVEEWEEMVDVI